MYNNTGCRQIGNGRARAHQPRRRHRAGAVQLRGVVRGARAHQHRRRHRAGAVQLRGVVRGAARQATPRHATPPHATPPTSTPPLQAETVLDDSDDKMYDEAKALLAEAKINVEYKRAQRESRTPTQQLTKPPRPPAWPSLFDSPSTVRTLLNELGFSDSDDPASDDSDDNMVMYNEAKAPGAEVRPVAPPFTQIPAHATLPHPPPPHLHPTQPNQPTPPLQDEGVVVCL